MKFFRHFSITILLVTLLMIVSNKLQSQSTHEIANVNYRFEGAKMLVTYDIIKAKSGETYTVSMEVVTVSGERIVPVSIFGDIKRGIVPGKKRTLIWDTHADDVVLDEDFTLQITAEPEGRRDVVPDSIVRKYEFPHTTDIGLGLGLDYGGVFGAKFTYSPIKYLGIFAAGGYQVGGFGWQFGVKGYFIPKTSRKGFRPNLKVMYGINAAIYIENYDKYDKLYPGFSLGPGMEFRFGRLKKHGFDIDLNFPIRSQDYYDDYDIIKNDPNIVIEVEPLPITISMGYHMEF
jgi:hypothetical protein